jgi:ribosomal protein S18 acetylase RimI-like enzyme
MIRKPTKEEASILAKFNRDAAVEAGNAPLDSEKSEKGVIGIIQNPERGFYLVYEKDGEIVSMILVTFEWSDWSNGNCYMIGSAYTHPDHRKSGYFTALFREVEKIAQKDPECCNLKLTVRNDNYGAQEVYKKLGFKDNVRMVMKMDI